MLNVSYFILFIYFFEKFCLICFSEEIGNGERVYDTVRLPSALFFPDGFNKSLHSFEKGNAKPHY